MRILGIGELRRREPDVRAHHDERWSSLICRCLKQCGLDGSKIVGLLAEIDDLPAVGTEAGDGVIVESQLGGAIDRDVVVVVDAHQATEAEVTGQGGGFVRDTLLETPVASDRPDPVVDKFSAVLRPQSALSDRQPHRVGESLPEGAGRHLDAWRDADLWVPWGTRAELAERPQVIERQVVPSQVQHRVLEDRCVSCREDETIPIGPRGVVGVEGHHPAEENLRHRRQCHRRPAVAGAGRADCVHGQRPDHADRQILPVVAVGHSTLLCAHGLRLVNHRAGLLRLLVG